MTARRTARLADPRRRLRAGLIVIGAVLLVLAGRLVQLQGLEATAYAAQAERQRIRKVELPAGRGQIVDRNGVALALSVDARALYADPKLVTDAAGVAARLAPLLKLPVADLRERLQRHTRFVYLARGLDPQLAHRIIELRLAGLATLPETRRVYPNAGLGAAVVGFVGREGGGLGGVEFRYDKELSGTPGRMLVEEAALSGRQIPSGARDVVSPVAGTSYVLTLDRDIQWMAERALADKVRSTHAKGGTIIVMSPRTGEVLALATAPSFDPNNPTKARPEARGNPALSEVYEPGSINKVITAAAALESGIVTPSTPVVVGQSVRVADKTFTDVHFGGTRTLSFTGVIAKSSNVGTIQVAQRLGSERLYEYLRRFGFGEKTGVRFPGESAGLMPHYKVWSGSQVGTVPIGQGVSVTALQIASAYATVANGGVRVTPSLVRGTVGRDGRLVPGPAPARTAVVSPKTAAELTAMLEAAVTKEGTAYAARIDGYRVAGKTGTARKVRPDGRGYAGYMSSFIGFAPADKPELVVAVTLNEPVPIFGGVVAAPVFRSVMGFALSTLRIPPTGRPAPAGVPLVLRPAG